MFASFCSFLDMSLFDQTHSASNPRNRTTFFQLSFSGLNLPSLTFIVSGKGTTLRLLGEAAAGAFMRAPAEQFTERCLHTLAPSAADFV
jgi:hypothetical protein